MVMKDIVKEKFRHRRRQKLWREAKNPKVVVLVGWQKEIKQALIDWCRKIAQPTWNDKNNAVACRPWCSSQIATN
jgi:hypothetical protein